MLRLSWDCARFGVAGAAAPAAVAAAAAAAAEGTTTAEALEGAATILLGDAAPLHAAETTTGTTSLVRWLPQGGVAAAVAAVGPGVGHISATDIAGRIVGAVEDAGFAGKTSTI